jgi:S-(hydroxymethyl)glutathione dehydrogenase / alcohol dehydrogenase
MTMAAVVVAHGKPVDVRDVELAAPKAGEIRIAVRAAGVCHSDLSVQNGTIPFPLPVVLGHECAAEVIDVGEGVSRFEVGDHVVTSFHPRCGRCCFCTRGQGYLCESGAIAARGGLLDGTPRFSADGVPIHQMAMLGTFAEETVIPEISAVRVPAEVPMKIAALISCGVLTGVGAATNTASIRQGDTIAVVGCGGVGLNVLQGARIAGAEEIIAIDRYDSKLALAKQFCATDVVNASACDPAAAVRDLTQGRGADVTFEVIGLETTITQALEMTRNGGETILVGIPRMDVTLSVPAALTFLYTNKTLRGCWYGSSNVDRDVPKLLDLYERNELKLDELISREIKLEDVNDAFTAMESGEVARSMIVF